MFYISAPELDHLQIRWPVLRSEGDKSRNWMFQNLFDYSVEYFFSQITTCSKTDENILLAWKRDSTGRWWTWGLDYLQQSWWHICPPLMSISCWSCSLFPWFWKGSINIFLSSCTKPASLYKEYLRFSNQDLDITDLRQNLFIINHHMSKDFVGQHT